MFSSLYVFSAVKHVCSTSLFALCSSSNSHCNRLSFSLISSLSPSTTEIFRENTAEYVCSCVFKVLSSARVPPNSFWTIASSSLLFKFVCFSLHSSFPLVWRYSALAITSAFLYSLFSAIRASIFSWMKWLARLT